MQVHGYLAERFRWMAFGNRDIEEPITIDIRECGGHDPAQPCQRNELWLQSEPQRTRIVPVDLQLIGPHENQVRATVIKEVGDRNALESRDLAERKVRLGRPWSRGSESPVEPHSCGIGAQDRDVEERIAVEFCDNEIGRPFHGERCRPRTESALIVEVDSDRVRAQGDEIVPAIQVDVREREFPYVGARERCGRGCFEATGPLQEYEYRSGSLVGDGDIDSGIVVRVSDGDWPGAAGPDEARSAASARTNARAATSGGRTRGCVRELKVCPRGDALWSRN